MDKIYDICFVFSVSNICTGNAFCEGIMNAFFIRFRCDNELIKDVTNQPEHINDSYYYCFASFSPLYINYGSCYHSCIWTMIINDS